jgi:hypothetical protein
MNISRYTFSLSVLLALGCSPAFALPLLGSELSSFSVLGGVSVTNTDSPSTIVTTLSGNLGVTNVAASGITGFWGAKQDSGPGVVEGSVFQGLQYNAFAMTANKQLVSAMASLEQLTPLKGLLGDLGGLTLAPGVYAVAGTATNLTGNLILDGGGNANATWVFLMSSSLITSTYSSVSVINAGSGSGVYWDVGSSATLNTGTTFVGNILAHTSITMGSDVTLCGRALANTGDVTLISDTIGCGGNSDFGSDGLSGGLTISTPGGLPVIAKFTPTSIKKVPEPPTYPMMFAGLALLGFMVNKRSTSAIATQA